METILVRPDGSKVKIAVNVYGSRLHGLEWEVSVFTCKKGKRTWSEHPETLNNYEYRRLPTDREIRLQWIKEQQLQVVTAGEIFDAKMAAWEKHKPTL